MPLGPWSSAEAPGPAVVGQPMVLAVIPIPPKHISPRAWQEAGHRRQHCQPCRVTPHRRGPFLTGREL